MRAQWAGVVIVGALLALALAGCVGSDEDAAGEGRFVTLLGLVPDKGDNAAQLHLADWVVASELAGEDQPTDADEVVDWVIELNDELDFAFNPALEWWTTTSGEPDEFEDELGFHFGQIDGSILAGLPPESSTAVVGRFDPRRVEEAVEDDPVWSDRLEIIEHDDEDYYSWDDEPEVGVEDPTAARPLGQGGNLFVTESEVLWALSTQTMEEMLDTRSGGDSLADDQNIRAAAEVLDERQAFVAIISEPLGDCIDSVTSTGIDADEPRLAAYETLAIGNIAVDGDEQRGLIVLVNDAEDTAEENAERLEEILDQGESAMNGQPWDEAFDIDEITTDGRLTLAVVDFDEASPRALVDAIFRCDSLFWPED